MKRLAAMVVAVVASVGSLAVVNAPVAQAAPCGGTYTIVVGGFNDPTSGRNAPFSVAKVSAEEIKVPAVGDVLGSLAGKVAGATIRPSGQPGGDLSIQLRSASGRICSLALSFNNDGPLGTTFRYIGDTATYVARYDDLWTGHGEPVALSTSDSGVVRQDREFVAAIRECA